ncbi:MAG: HNH endonuclease [Bacteroidetes bacterium]|nr:HNH endonuclease [Bacteroidota bacterium]
MRKLSALKFLSRYFRYDNKKDYSAEEIAYIIQFANIIKKKNANPIAISAACAGLDLLIPEWRTVATIDILSKTVSRDSSEVRAWRLFCLRRDNYTCVECGSKNDLSVHHICEWAYFPGLRIENDNGLTLCANCHSAKHPQLSLDLFIKNKSNSEVTANAEC